MEIEILVCTLGEGIRRVPEVLMPPMDGLGYLISWQTGATPITGEAATQDIPEELRHRPDVRVVQLPGTGLSRNRNHALAHARGEWLVIADDDCRYTPQHIRNLQEARRRHPEADILLMQAHDYDGNFLHPYPSEPYEYKHRPRGSFVSSWEISMRRTAPLPRFDERFGLGAWLGCGEEEVFVHQASRRGLTVCYEPLSMVVTAAGTTGTKFAVSPAVQRAKGGVLCIIHGPIGATLRGLKFIGFTPGLSIRQRCKAGLEVMKGIIYVLTHHPLP